MNAGAAFGPFPFTGPDVMVRPHHCAAEASIDAEKIAALLDKISRRITDVRGNYVGFEIPDEFVVGYGLDYKEMGRNLKDIYKKID